MKKLKQLSGLFASLCILSSCSPAGVELQLEPLGTQKVFSNLEKEDHVHVLEDNAVLQFQDDIGNIRLSNSGLSDIKKGDVIVGNGSNPLLLKVASDVTLEKDNSLSMLTKLASFSDLSDKDFEISVLAAPHIRTKDSANDEQARITDNLISKADAEPKSKFQFDDRGNIRVNDLELYHFKVGKSGTLAEMKTGLKKSSKSKLEKSLKISNAGEGEFSAKIATARFHFHPTFRSNYSFSGAKVKKLKTRLDMKFIYEMEIVYNNTTAIKMDLSYDLLPQIKVPIRVPGAVPIYIDLEIDLPAGIRVSASKPNEVRIKYKGQYNIFSEMNYDVATGLSSHGDQGFLEKENEIIDDSDRNIYSAELYLEPKLSARFYRVLGPYVYFTPYVKAEVEKPAKAQKHELFMGLRGGMGLQVSEPIFLSNILDLSSPDLFNLYRSWDIFSESTDEKQKISKEDIKPKAKEKIYVSELTAEGFFVFKLADPELANSVGFSITEQPKNGFMIPAPGFNQTGNIYYFPKNTEEKVDSFSFRVDRNGLKSDSHKVEIELADDILEYNKKDKFGASTSSVQVAYSSPYQREDYAKHYQIGGDPQVFASINYFDKEPGIKLVGHNSLNVNIPTGSNVMSRTIFANEIKVSRLGLIEIPNVLSSNSKKSPQEIENFIYGFSFCNPLNRSLVEKYFEANSLVLECSNSTQTTGEFTMIVLNHDIQLGFPNLKNNNDNSKFHFYPTNYGIVSLFHRENTYAMARAKILDATKQNSEELSENEWKALEKINSLEAIDIDENKAENKRYEEDANKILNKSLPDQLASLEDMLEEIKFLREMYLPSYNKEIFLEGMVSSENRHHEEAFNFENDRNYPEAQ